MKNHVINGIVILLTTALCISDLEGQNTPNKVVAGIPVNYVIDYFDLLFNGNQGMNALVFSIYSLYCGF